MIVFPNVKVNLGLSVLRRRLDGFHDLQTLFVPYFGLHDTLEVISGDDYSRTSAGLAARYGLRDVSEPLPEGFIPNLVQGLSEDGKLMITVGKAEGVDWDPLTDLCARAYRLLDSDFGLPPVKIFLEKTSPVGAGLGGGSADAAFTLRALNEMFALGLSDTTLAAYASKLGSDCAFFIYNAPMFGEGRGEKLTAYKLPDIDFGSGNAERYELKVVVPEGISVSTAEAYKGIVPRFSREEEAASYSLKEALSLPMERWKDLVVNDFERTVFAAHPELARIKQSLYDSGAVYASMSGSGSALFGIYKKV